MTETAAGAIRELANLLRRAGAVSRVDEGRLAPSVVYDLQYRAVVVAFAFEIHSKNQGKVARIRADQLRLLQFVAVRPWLVGVMREWSRSRGDAQLSMMTSDRLRRGFLTDTTHSRVVELLVAGQALAWAQTGSHLVEGPHAALLVSARRVVRELDLFTAERAALTELTRVRITNAMLEGW